MGSSPLTRGAPPLVFHKVLCAGLIPAHAGSTSYAKRTWNHRKAHPRSRGEHLLLAFW